MKLFSRGIGALFIAAALGVFSAFGQSGPPAFPEPMFPLNVWYFEDTNWISAASVPPLSQTNLALVPTWDDNGLQVDSSDPAWLNYPMVSDGWPNMSLTNGTIRFWFLGNWMSTNLDGGTGPGVWSRLIDVGAWTSNASYGWWSLYTDPSGCNLYFSAQSNNGVATNYLSAPISWDGATWHEIELAYSSSNCALFLDGALATNGPGVSILPPPEALTNGFYIGSDVTGNLQAHGQFDELWTFENQQHDTNEIAAEYAELASIANPPRFFRNDDPSPGSGGGTSGSSSPFYSQTYGSNDFWLEALPLGTNAYNTNLNSLTFVLHGTLADIDYQIQFTTNIQKSNTIWAVVGDVLGSEVTNFTTTTAIKSGLPTLYFRAVAVTLDTEGVGLPDWWQLRYFGSLGVDPFADPMGDGYNNLYKYQNSMSPNTYYTPRAPVGAVAAVNTNRNIMISWPAAANLASNGAGAVTGYTLQIQYLNYYNSYFTTNYVNFGTNQFSFETNLDSLTLDYMIFPFDLSLASPPPGYDPPALYSLRINYANGSSYWTTPSAPFDPSCTVNGATVRGPQGKLYLAISSVSLNVTAIRIMGGSSGTWYPVNFFGTDFFDFVPQQFFNPVFGSGDTNWPLAYFDVPVSNIVNGLYQIPPSQVPLFEASSIVIAGMSKNGNLGNVVLASPLYEDSFFTTLGVGSHNLNVPFLDGRTNIAQNINLLLRGAGSANPVNLALWALFSGVWYQDYNLTQPTNYVWNGFSFLNYGYLWDGHDFYGANNYMSQRNEFEPFEESSLYTNLIFNLGLFDSTGAFGGPIVPDYSFGVQIDDSDSTRMFDTFSYITNNSSYPLAAMPSPPLDATAENWILSPEDIYYSQYYGYGTFTGNPNGSFTLNSSARNIYGLQYEAIKYLDTNQTWSVASSGATFMLGQSNSGYFQDVTPPILDTVEYYFGRPAIDPLPGEGNFATTNQTSPVIIVPFAKPFLLTAWAKQSLYNGYAGVFAYPQQYFDKAYLCDTDGTPTTNQTGILSEYGDFFPTQPGQMVLTTKPDGATGSTNQCRLNVIKLQLDVNHDGTMDTSFAGPDNTSPDRPFVFWVNNDSDKAPYFVGDTGEDVDNPSHPDCNLTNIPSPRDLEDWARLWICGLPVVTNYQVTLSWTNIKSGSPAINLAKPFETNGGTLYLTDADIADTQANGTGPFAQSYKFARITTNNSYTFPSSYLTGNATNFFIFEGAGVGAGQLTLTISQGSNVLAQTSAWLDLRDVKNMYEQVHITGVTNLLPGNGFCTSGYQQLNWMDSIPSEDTNIVVFVHGWRMGVWNYYNFSESMFKRLYWQGYRGRFASIRWDTLSKDDYQPISLGRDYLTYNRSEFRAWESAKGVSDYLTSLKQRFPNYSLNVCSHSMGGVVMAEALKLQLAAGQQNVRNYVLMQAAVPASCYDPSFTNYAPFISEEASQPTPNTYRSYPGSIAGTVSGHLVDFYNTNDYALATGSLPLIGGINWEANQENFKPDAPQGYRVDSTGTNCANGFNVISDSREIMSFCARPRSKAVGAQPNVGGVIYMSGQIDLTTNFNFRSGSDQHSAQFNWSVQQVSGFYQQLGISLGVFQPPTP